MQYTIDISNDQYLVGPDGEEFVPVKLDVVAPGAWYFDAQRHHVAQNTTELTIRGPRIVCDLVRWKGDPGDVYYCAELSPKPHVHQRVDQGEQDDADRHANHNYFRTERAAMSRLKAHCKVMRTKVPGE